MQEIIYLINEMSPYLLLGFFMAGLMHAFIPRAMYHRYLSRRGFRSVASAALLGIPLPLCSCGVIPTAMSLRRDGASKGAVVSFLIATPQTGVDSILATASLLGIPFAVVRPLVALCTSLFGGWLVDRWGGGDTDGNAGVTAGGVEASGVPSDRQAAAGVAGRLKEALHYAFVEMMQDIGKWLVVGLVVAGIITVCVPDRFFALFAGNSLLSILFVLLFSLPMYLCATGSIPIAVALMLKGLTPGAALVLLMAGPACNAASVMVVGKVLGRRTLLLYLAAIVGGAVGFALGIDYLLPREWFAAGMLPTGAAGCSGCCASSAAGAGPSPMTDWWGIGCSLLLAGLLLHAWIRSRWGAEKECTCTSEEEACGVNRYRIEGMECNHCRANVEQALRSVSGVTRVNVSLQQREARVEGTYKEEELLQAVSSIGFEIHHC